MNLNSMKKTSLIFCASFIFFVGFAQENRYLGKVQYVKETKLSSGNYSPRINGETDTYFNNDSYVFITGTGLDIGKLTDKVLKSMPSQFRSDSFEVARQREKITAQLEKDLADKAVTKTFINYSTNISVKPKQEDGQKFCVVDTLGRFNWELKEDTMRLDDLLCQNARVFFVDKYYSVWFAPSIPFAVGPFNLHGLPGIIVLATSEDEKTRYRMTSLTYPLETPYLLNSCTGEKQISGNEFRILEAKRRETAKQRAEEFKQKNDKQ